MYVLVNFFILDCRLANQFLGKKLYFWLCACSVLIVMPLLYVRPSFPLVSWMAGVR